MRRFFNTKRDKLTYTHTHIDAYTKKNSKQQINQDRSSPNWAQHNLHRQSPSGAADRGGEQQYMW